MGGFEEYRHVVAYRCARAEFRRSLFGQHLACPHPSHQAVLHGAEACFHGIQINNQAVEY